MNQIGLETYYGQLRSLGLKPTGVPSVWQTLDEQDRFNIGYPSEMSETERASHLEHISKMLGKTIR